MSILLLFALPAGQSSCDAFVNSEISLETCTDCNSVKCTNGTCATGYHSFDSATGNCSSCSTHADAQPSLETCTTCNSDRCLTGTCASGYLSFDSDIGTCYSCSIYADAVEVSLSACTQCDFFKCTNGTCASGYHSFDDTTGECSSCSTHATSELSLYSCSNCDDNECTNGTCASSYHSFNSTTGTCSSCSTYADDDSLFACTHCDDTKCTSGTCATFYHSFSSDTGNCSSCNTHAEEQESLETCTVCNSVKCLVGTCATGYHSFNSPLGICLSCSTHANDDSLFACSECTDDKCTEGICAVNYTSFSAVNGNCSACDIGLENCTTCSVYADYENTISACTDCNENYCTNVTCAFGHNYFNQTTGSCINCETFATNAGEYYACYSATVAWPEEEFYHCIIHDEQACPTDRCDFENIIVCSSTNTLTRECYHYDQFDTATCDVSLNCSVDYTTSSEGLTGELCLPKPTFSSVNIVNYPKPVNQPEDGYSGAVFHEELNRIYFTPFIEVSQDWPYIDALTGEIGTLEQDPYDPFLSGGVNKSGSSFADLDDDSEILNFSPYHGGVYSNFSQRVFFLPHDQVFQYWHGINSTGHLFVYDSYVVDGNTTREPDLTSSNAYRGGAYFFDLKRVYLAPQLQRFKSVWHYIDDLDIPKVREYEHNMTNVPEYTDAVYSKTQNVVYFIPRSFSQSHPDLHYVDNLGKIGAYQHNVNVSVGLVGSFEGSHRFSGAVHHDLLNRIYFVPADYFMMLFYIDCNSPIGTLGTSDVGSNMGRYNGGIYSTFTHRIYLSPYYDEAENDNAIFKRRHYIDETGSIITYNTSSEVGTSFSGGAYAHALKRAYPAPSFSMASNWEYIDENPLSNETARYDNTTNTTFDCDDGYYLDSTTGSCTSCSTYAATEDSLSGCAECNAAVCTNGTCASGYHSFHIQYSGREGFGVCYSCSTYAADIIGLLACTDCDDNHCTDGTCDGGYHTFDSTYGNCSQCSAICIDTYYPLYSTVVCANFEDGGTSHTHTFTVDGTEVTYFMPDYGGSHNYTGDVPCQNGSVVSPPGPSPPAPSPPAPSPPAPSPPDYGPGPSPPGPSTDAPVTYAEPSGDDSVVWIAVGSSVGGVILIGIVAWVVYKSKTGANTQMNAGRFYIKVDA